MNIQRLRRLNEKPSKPGPVLYWMNRDMRVRHNWALIACQEIAKAQNQSVAVVFCLSTFFLGATIRQYGFMLAGLEEMQKELHTLGIPFYIIQGDPTKEISDFVNIGGYGTLITDFSPLKVPINWKSGVAEQVSISMLQVDAHNCVPCWLASPKQEYAARTIRPKIHALLPHYLDDFPRINTQQPAKPLPITNWTSIRTSLQVDTTVPEVNWCKPGEKAAQAALQYFLENGLPEYANKRNNPSLPGQSNLSPYLHFGMLSAQYVALSVASTPDSETKNAFLEELIIRRELSENFCYYNTNYDSPDCFPEWASNSLALHANDLREFLYTQEQFEQAQTHDPLWNASQRQLLIHGKMHGYMRMYWAKKILEWTTSSHEAQKIAIYLNDRYELDGRDPNGYTGIAWSIGGVHDRPWFNRPIFGSIRYMSANGCRAKFNVDAYIAHCNALQE